VALSYNKADSIRKEVQEDTLLSFAVVVVAILEAMVYLAVDLQSNKEKTEVKS
jgi:hypothetical protein